MLTTTATDLAGNISKPSATTAITIDTTAPATPATPTLAPGSDTGVSHTDGLTNDKTPVVTGTTEANATVQLFGNGVMLGSGQADASGRYAIAATTLGEGAQALTVRAIDAAGNASAGSGPLNIVVDSVPATASITPGNAVEGAGSVTFTVAFSTAVASLTASDFKLVSTGSVNGSVQTVSGSGGLYTVTVNGLSGEGTVGLALAGTGVTDLAGDPVTVSNTVSHAVSGTTTPSTVLVSASATGIAGTGVFGSPSASGRVVAFNSITGNLVSSGAADGTDNVFVKDTQTGAITLVSAGDDDHPADGDSFGASLSADGTRLAFASEATNLVEGGTAAGETNVYVATLTEGAGGPTVTEVQLVSAGNGQRGEGSSNDGSQADIAPILSSDGSTVVFDSTLPLVAGAESGVENVYAENIASGAITLVSGGTGQNEYAYVQTLDPSSGETFAKATPEPNKKPGGGGDFNSDVTSVSADGQLIGYESYATDLGARTLDPNTVTALPSRGYVYNLATGATTTIDGTTLIRPSATFDSADLNTFAPVLSGNGSTVFFAVHYVVGATQVQALYQETLATGVITPVTAANAADGDETYSTDVSTSRGGGLVLATENPGLYTDQDPYQIVLDNPTTDTATQLPGGFEPFLTTSGNAYTFVEAPNGLASAELFETNLGVSAGINTIGTNDKLGAGALAKAVASGGLAVSGTTNAPAGATVILQLYGAQDSNIGVNSPAVTGFSDGSGHWSATIPVTVLQSGDGNFALVLQIGTPAGASFFSVRDFVVDTKAPAQPDASKLDAGSDTGMAHDGSATSQDTPTLTGTTEAGATVTLYDSSNPSPGLAIGTAVADQNGVYTVTASTLKDGKHTLDVTATDAAGNVSAASDGVTVTVDTLVPIAPVARLEPASDTGISDSDGLTSIATPNIIGTAEAGTMVTLYDTDGVAMLGTATVGAEGKFTIAASSLSDGAHTLTVTDTDNAGNVSPASAPIAVTVDTLPPFRPTITSVTGALVGGKLAPLVMVSGTAEPGGKVTLQLNGGDPVLGETTAASDGDYSIESEPLPAGDGQTLAVITYDAAANASQASLPVDIAVTDAAFAPPGTPPNIPTLLALLTDGPIEGATVFADTNGNGTRDTNEGSAVTGVTGAFQLADSGGELIATGGTDTTTGLSLPGALTAPAHSTVIDPLTTLLDAYIAQTGAGLAAANAAVAGALGLLSGGATDLTALDPAVAPGAAAVANAQVADLAVDITAALSHRVGNGVLPNAIFADVFTVLAAQIAALPPGGMLEPDDPATLLATVEATAGLVSGGVLAAVATATEQIVAAGNARLDADAAAEQGQALLTGIANVETVEQAAAAAALAEIGATPSLGATLVPQYTGQPLIAAASVTAALILDAPRLVASSDQGVSDRDNVTADLTPTFVGTALPGTFVTLLEFVGPGQLATPVSQGQVVGSAQADASGHYSITSTMLTVTGSLQYPTQTLAFAAVGSATNQNLAAGSIIALPQGALPQLVSFDTPGLSDGARIQDATSVASDGNDAGHSALLLYVDALTSDFVKIQVFADGGTTPIASGADIGNNNGISLTTTPLSLGTHTLTVTETLRGGETISGNPSYNVKVTGATVVDGTATAVGPIAGGTVTENDKSPQGVEEGDVARSVTGADGIYAATLPALPNPAKPLTLTDGYDTITGLPISSLLAAGYTTQDGKGGATLTAPDDYSAVSPFSSIVADLDTANGFAGDDDTDGNASETLAALGLSSTLDLENLDPLTRAQSGDSAPLLTSIKLLDTVSILGRLLGYTFQPFAEYIATHRHLDLDNAAVISAAIAPAVAAKGSGPFTAPQLVEVAAIVAAGNAALDAHAAAASSLADTLSYAFADERLEQNDVAAALNQAYDQAGDSTDSVLPLVASYTGAALDQAILAERGAATQAVSLRPVGPAITGASSVTFVITFSKAVTGLAAASFQLVTNGGLQGAVIDGVTAVAGSGGTAYDVTVSTGIGQGTLALTYRGGGVATSAGKPITAGTIAPAETYLPLSGSGKQGSIAVGDFNGDGRPDAVLVYSSPFVSVTPYLNTGDGSFQAQTPLSNDAGSSLAAAPIVADVTGDGKADILVADLDTNVAYGSFGPTYGDAITVLPGNGDGSFQQPINTRLDFAPTDMVAGDFNGDGLIDLALSDVSGNLHILLGDGAGGFTPIGSFAGNAETAAISFASLAVGDFNGDGRLDLVVGNYTTGVASIFLGAGDGTFTAGPTLAAGTLPDAIAVGDLNHDGIADIAVADDDSGVLGTSTVTVLLGHGDGTFSPAAAFTSDPTLTGVADLRSVAIGDLDNDGTPDLVVVGGNGDVSVLLGNGDGTFKLGSQSAGVTPNLVSQSIALADVDGDGRTDILTPGENLAPDLNEDGGLDVFRNEPATVVGSTSQAITINRPIVASPLLTKTSGAGTLAQSGNAYTLDLGTVAQGVAASVGLALDNSAAAPADSFDGLFFVPTSGGFTVTGAMLPAAIAAGSSYAGLRLTADTSTPGSHTETITFAPRDVTNDPAVINTLSADASAGDQAETTMPPANASGNDVALELAPITLTITDNVQAGAASPPTISGTVAGQRGSDAASMRLFALAAIADPNANQTETVTVMLSAAANGTLSDPNAATDGSAVTRGVFSVSGTAAQVSTALEALVFTPTMHQVSPGQNVATSFTITDMDTAGESVQDATTSFVATAVEDPPAIGGTRDGQATTSQQTIQPFTTATITDPDFGATIITTVTLRAAGLATDANGALSGTGLSQTGPGVYTLRAASPAAEQSLLQALVFTPSSGTGGLGGLGGNVTTEFDLQDSDGMQSTADNATTVTVASAAMATLLSPSTILFQNTRVGTAEDQAISIANTGPVGGAALAVTASTTGDALATGSVVSLAPGAVDTSDIRVGLDTSNAGARSGSVALQPISVLAGNTIASPSPLPIAVSGFVYRPATAAVTSTVTTLHVGESGLVSLRTTNADPADGFSENLVAALTSVSGPFGATTGQSTGVIAAGAASSALTLSVSTATAAQLTGTATVGLTSDGGAVGTGVDGLGKLALASQSAPLSVTVDNYAVASLQLLSGAGTLSASGPSYTLDLGIVAQGTAPVTEMLGVVNAASGPADLLSGNFALSNANAIGLTGFGDFAGLAAGQTDGGLAVSLDTSGAGTFTRTVTLTSAGSNASGFSGALTPETLTITGVVAPTTATGSSPGTSTPMAGTPVYRFYNTVFGSDLFTQSLAEAQSILANRPDLTEQTNNFGAVNPQTDPVATAVYRLFEASTGTHFLTANYQEYLGLTTAGTSTYRPDLTSETGSTFDEDNTQQAGDVAVYRFFDTVHGTQFLTGSQTEYAGLTTAGSSAYRPDLTSEGIAFYAPAGRFPV